MIGWDQTAVTAALEARELEVLGIAGFLKLWWRRLRG